MILLYIYLGICLLTLVMTLLLAINITYKFRKRYPNMRIQKSHWSGEIFSYLKLIVASATPIFNLALLWVVIFDTENSTEKALWNLYKKYSTEGEQNETQEDK